MARVDTWVERCMNRTGQPTATGSFMYPMGRTMLKREAEKYCGAYWGRLTPDHCMRLHSRFTAMKKELGDLSVEFGMAAGPNWDAGTRWPYAAIARVEGNRVVAGWMVIPGAQACPYYVWHSFPVPGKKRGVVFRSLRMMQEMIPVHRPVQAEATRAGRVALTRDDVAHPDDVRKGDAYLFDLTLACSPSVAVEGRYIGRAVQFAALDEIIDIVRMSLVFASLPSA